MNNQRVEGHKYICNADESITFSIYADGTPNCAGKLSFEYTLPAHTVLAQNCKSDTCDSAQYMELKKYIYRTGESVDCERTSDAVADIDYSTELYVVDICMNDGNGSWIMYQCRNNLNDPFAGGYTITTYKDSQCSIKLNSFTFHDSECSEKDKIRTNMVWCNGPNNIAEAKQEHEPLIDCNYFINDHNDPFHVVGEPLNECMSIRHGQSLYSKMYQCNTDHSGIEEIVYFGEGCDDDNIWQTVPRPEFEIFHCDSDYFCNAINETDDVVMVGKQYTNNTCDIFDASIADFWTYQHIIIDVCWPIEDNLYTMMSCDEGGFVYYSLYYDAQCVNQLIVGDNVFNSDDCMFGKLFETVSCPHWVESVNTSTTTTTTTTTTISPIINTSNISTTEIRLETTEVTETTMYVESTLFNGTEEGKKEGTPECKNVFGGGDVGGISCNVWADIIWALIVLVAGVIVCFAFWCWFTLDKSIKKQVNRRQSKLSISTGNKNEDIERILVQQESKRRSRKVHPRPAPIQEVHNASISDSDSHPLDL